VTNIIHHNKWIYSTGRDGFYQKFLLNDDGSLVTLERKRACKGMDWIEGLIFTPYGDVLVYGFYMQSQFAIWSRMRNEIIQKLHCGGGYRSWDFTMKAFQYAKRMEMALVYLKGPKIMLSSLPANDYQTILKEGLHGRELTCISPLGHLENGGFVFATGSEDTRVNITRYNYNTRRLDVIHCIQSHVGSVKSIAFVMDNCLPLLKSSIASTGRISNSKTHKDDKFGNFIGNNQPYLLFTCGSRTSLKCSCIVFEGFGSHINSFVLSEIGSRDKRKTQKEKGNDLRFMSLQIISLDRYITFPDSAQYYCIVIGCSDGFIRIYGFSSLTGEFCLIVASGFHKRCIQEVVHFHCNINSRDHHFILSGSTDGNIALWDITECIDEFLRSKHDRYFVSRITSRELKPASPPATTTVKNANDQSDVEVDGASRCNVVAVGCDGDVDDSSGGVGGFRFGNDSRALGSHVYSDRPTDDYSCTGDDGESCGSDSVSTNCYADDNYSDDCDAHIDDSKRSFHCIGYKAHQKFFDSSQLHASKPVCSRSLSPLYVFTAHQSGIHSLSIINIRDSSFILASGGDDNAIFTSKLTIRKEFDCLICNVHWTDKNLFAHYSTITAVHLIRPSFLVTCSIDQRLKFWWKDNVDRKLIVEETDWRLVQTSYTDVADPSGLACFIQKDKVVAGICGVGLEVKNLEVFDNI